MYSKRFFSLLCIFIALLFILDNTAMANDRPETLKDYFQSFATGKNNQVRDSWISPDKGYHIVGSIISTTLVGQLSLRAFETTRQNSQIIGAGASFTLGVLKEVRDSAKPNNKFSWKDLAANGVGIVIGILLLGID